MNPCQRKEGRGGGAPSEATNEEKARKKRDWRGQALGELLARRGTAKEMLGG